MCLKNVRLQLMEVIYCHQYRMYQEKEMANMRDEMILLLED